MENKDVNLNSFKEVLNKWATKPADNKDPELVVQLFGYIDENGKTVCKALDLFNQLMLEEIKKQKK